MSICTNFNCYLAASFSQKEQKIALLLLRKIRKYGLIAVKSDFDLLLGTRIETLIFGLYENKVVPILEPIWESVQNAGVKAITILDDDYPVSLLHLNNPPFCIFLLSYNSDFQIPSIENNLCVVGSRNATTDAVNITKSLAAKALSSGLCIVSGLASGIDVAAHEGCLQQSSSEKIIAVLGNDACQCFPTSSTKIYNKILSTGGAILSEYPPGTAPMKHQFIARNRIMAALSKCTVVVQAKEKSGALHTARTALELGRDVAVLPWSLSVHAAKGSNMLLRDGAHPILIFEDLIALYPDLKSKKENSVLSPDQNPQHAILEHAKFKEVIDYLSEHPTVSSVELKERFGVSEVDLITLEMELLIKRSATSMVSLF